MSLAMQRAASQLLDRPVQGHITMGQWMEHQFPKIIEFAASRCEEATRQARIKLSAALSNRDLLQPLGSSRFEMAYQKAAGMLRENPSYGREMMKQLGVLEQQREQYHMLKDMAVQMEDDILPPLKDLSHDPSCEYVCADDIEVIWEMCADIAEKTRDIVPKIYQVDNPQETLNHFAADMKELLKCTHENDIKRKQNSFVDKVAPKNRLEDYWKKR